MRVGNLTGARTAADTGSRCPACAGRRAFRESTVKPAATGSASASASGAASGSAVAPRVTRLLGDLTAGAVSTLVMLCYAMSLGTLIFSADLARYAELGVPTALISCIVTALVVALTSSMRLNIAG